jgi:uncharacterized membrane protein
MTRALVLPFLIIAVAVGGFLSVRSSQSSQQVQQQEETQASQAASATDFAAALPALQAWFADHGTYAGVTLPPAFAVTVVRADDTSYCLQAGSEHLAGPGGTAQPGPC